MKKRVLFLSLAIAMLLTSCSNVKEMPDHQVQDHVQDEVQEPHRPDYGNTAYKDQMLAAAVSYLRQFMNDMQRGEEAKEWIHVQGYLVNFHEYDESAYAWFLKENGEAVNIPFIFIEDNGTIRADGMKGYSLDHIFDRDPGDPNRVMVEQQIKDSIKRKKSASNEWEDTHSL